MDNASPARAHDVRSASDYVAVVALVLSAALLCLIVYQGETIAGANEAITYLREHCLLTP